MNSTNEYPKIGIRPIIDGRLGGVRESLEDITMKLALAVADLYSKELKYPNGEPVECVISDSCIGGVKEATACAKKFRDQNVGVSLSVTPWILIFQKQFGVLMGQSDLEQFISRQHWQHIIKKDCLHLGYMDATFRILMILIFLMM